MQFKNLILTKLFTKKQTCASFPVVWPTTAKALEWQAADSSFKKIIKLFFIYISGHVIHPKLRILKSDPDFHGGRVKNFWKSFFPWDQWDHIFNMPNKFCLFCVYFPLPKFSWACSPRLLPVAILLLTSPMMGVQQDLESRSGCLHESRGHNAASPKGVFSQSEVWGVCGDCDLLWIFFWKLIQKQIQLAMVLEFVKGYIYIYIYLVVWMFWILWKLAIEEVKVHS